MDALLRKLRGLLGTAATWSVAWAAIFALLSVVVGIVDPDSIDAGEGPLALARIGAIFGFVSGGVFATLLALADGRRTLRELSVGRAALWGFLGTAAYPLLTSVHDGNALIVGPVGAALAAASVALAKRGMLDAAPRPPELAAPDDGTT